ncbi:MAG: glutamate ABC transporter substrate-binding protein [Solirubrobacteraceae bacterium]
MTAVLAGCGASGTPSAEPAKAPVVLPAGASLTSAPSAAGTAGAGTNCNATASLRPTGPLPRAGQMPAGSFMQKILQRGYLIAGVDQNTFLWGYRDPATGLLGGFDIDMLHQVSQAIFGNPNRIRFVVVPNAQRVPAVQSGAVDIVAETMTINCERKKLIDFSTVYYTAGQRILAVASSPISSAHDLAGRRVCATAGSTSLQNLTALAVKPRVRTVAVTNQSDCLVLLQQGLIDAISTDDTILQGLAAQDPAVRLVGPAFTSEPYGMAISKAHPEFVAFVNAVLARERADGTWASIYKRWLGRLNGGRAPSPPAATYTS